MAHAAAKRDRAALDLAGGYSVRAVARKRQIGERTLRRWLAEDEDFQAEVTRLRTELFTAATGTLCRLCGRAARKLGKLLDARSETVQLGAVRTVLEGAARLQETTNLAAEV